jgi:hypothetical protein
MSPSDFDRENVTRGSPREVQPSDIGGATLDGSGLVADPPSNATPAPRHPPERAVVDNGPDGQGNVATEVASSRVRFIRRFALGKGVSQAVLDRRWGALKNGHPLMHDRPSAHGDTEFSPGNLQPGLITECLALLISVPVLRMNTGTTCTCVCAATV